MSDPADVDLGAWQHPWLRVQLIIREICNFSAFNLPDGVYKFISIAQGLSTGKVALSEYYRFRVGGPNSSRCCP